MNFGYEYFCGANAVLELNGKMVLEAAGLSMTIEETQGPLYGYSSRFFDAVYRGQVLVQGNLLVNHVYADYLYDLVTQDFTGPVNLPPLEPSSIILQADNPDVLAQIQQYKDRFWNLSSATATKARVPNMHDGVGGMNLKVTFGERHPNNQYNGITGYMIENMYIKGKQHTVAIDENVIVDIYPYFARNIRSL